MRIIAAGVIAASIAVSSCSMLYQYPPTPLSDAAWRGDLPTVRRLVAAGADINELSGTPLFLAARGGHAIGPHLCHTEDPDRPALIAALLDMGANPNQRDGRPRTLGGSSGWTPIFVALHHHQFKSAEVLLDHGADVTLQSDQGITVTEMATVEGAPADLVNLIATKSEVKSLK